MSGSNKYIKGISNTANVQIKNIDAIIQKRSEMSKLIKPIGLADIVIYHFVKDGGFFGKKQQRTIFTFFSGLNTNPQNLSIFLRDMVNSMSKNSKQKLSKGQFIIYDIFNDTDCVVQISIPGNFQIYKLKNGKKELISNKEIDTMYVSSTIRSMVDKNLVWGKSYNLFGYKNVLEGYKQFLVVFIRVVEKQDVYISEDFQHKSTVKGSHVCSILFDFIKQKRVVHHSIELIQKQIANRGGYQKSYPKILILLAQLYSYDGKFAKSLAIIGSMLTKFENDPYLLYYQAKYMFKLMAVHQALVIVNNIVQFNQFQIWCLAAEIHIELKNYSEGLVCLNHASRIAGKSAKLNSKAIDVEVIYSEFEKLGKKNFLTSEDDITQRPKLMSPNQNPITIENFIQEKYKSIIQNEYWKLGFGQKIVYDCLRTVKYRLEGKKFQQLLQITFEQSKKQYPVVNFKSGISQSMFIDQALQSNQLKFTMESNRQQEQLPNFLKDDQIEYQSEQLTKGNRNLSIIPQLQSVIQNSQFEEKEKENLKMVPVKVKKELSQHLFKIIKAVISQSEIEKGQFEQNWAKVLPVYNKLRTSAKFNTFYVKKMFEIMIKIENYKSVIVLIAESLDSYEQTLSCKDIDLLPFWMQRYVFQIIEQKGLKFLNSLLQKMNFLDAAVIDCIELAKSWKIKGCTY